MRSSQLNGNTGLFCSIPLIQAFSVSFTFVSTHCHDSHFASFSGYICDYSSITDLQGLLHKPVCDCVLPVLAQTVCLGLTVSFLHKILCIHCSHFPLHPFTFPHVNLESEGVGKGSHLIAA